MNRHPELASKFSQRIDRQRKTAEDPKNLKVFFDNVSSSSHRDLTSLILCSCVNT